MPLNQSYKPLPLTTPAVAPSLPQVQRTAQPADPALALITDLHHSPCVVASHRDGLDATLQLMQRAGVRMVFVADVNHELVGMVTYEHIQGERPVLRATTAHVPHHELTVADVMVPVSQWDTVDLAVVRHACLGEVAATLHTHGLRYLLVTQTRQGVTTLRGLFSAARLEKALKTPIEPDLHSRSFAELGQALAH